MLRRHQRLKTNEALVKTSLRFLSSCLLGFTGRMGIVSDYSSACQARFVRKICSVESLPTKALHSSTSQDTSRRSSMLHIRRGFATLPNTSGEKTDTTDIEEIQVVPSSSGFGFSLHANPSDVFPNSEISLGEIDAYGFDYDYTLVEYTPHVQSLIYRLALQHLIQALKYPTILANCEYDPQFAIRGLHYDTNKGLLLKIDAVYNLQLGAVMLGRKQLSRDECLAIYDGLRLTHKYVETHLRILSDIFSLPQACLMSDVIELFRQHNFTFDPSIIYTDVKNAIAAIHLSGLLHSHVLSDISLYIDETPNLRFFLSRLLSAKKKTFLLTNSPYHFLEKGMLRLLGPDWMEFFDVVITSADKPNWYSHDRPHRVLDTHTGKLYWDKVTSFQKGHVYVSGGLKEFSKILPVRSNRTIYFGDHLFSDLKEPALMAGWRTGVVIPEIEDEVQIHNSHFFRSRLLELLNVENQIKQYQLNSHPQQQQMLEKRAQLRTDLKTVFNKNFGSCFRTHTNATLFAHDLRRYADIYTSKIENLLSFPIDYSFFPERSFLPHEAKIIQTLTEGHHHHHHQPNNPSSQGLQ